MDLAQLRKCARVGQRKADLERSALRQGWDQECWQRRFHRRDSRNAPGEDLAASSLSSRIGRCSWSLLLPGLSVTSKCERGRACGRGALYTGHQPGHVLAGPARHRHADVALPLLHRSTGELLGGPRCSNGCASRVPRARELCTAAAHRLLYNRPIAGPVPPQEADELPTAFTEFRRARHCNP